MNMIVGKKQIVLASLVVALGVAVYLNYQFAGEDLDLVTANTTAEEISVEDEKQENYGDAQFVDSKDVEEQSGEDSVSTSAEVGDSEYFSQARLTRTKTRDEAAETLQVMLSDVNLAQEQKDELTAQANALAQSIETEGKIENLIKAKGFEECMVYCSSDKVDCQIPRASGKRCSADPRHYPGTDTGSGRKYFHCPGQLIWTVCHGRSSEQDGLFFSFAFVCILEH